MAPKVTKVRFRFRRGRGGFLRMRVSEASTVRATIRREHGKRPKPVRLRRKVSKAGPVVFKLGKRRLKPGRYVVRITATDREGKTSKPVVKRGRVR